MTFYQDNRRNKSQTFSNDQFKLKLSDIMNGCVPNFDIFLSGLFKTELFIHSGDNIKPVYNDDGSSEDEIIDYLIDIPTASYILYTFYFEATPNYKNIIDNRISELNDAIGQRTGELVIKSY